ncbi:MAG: O-antigen ligase family protein [Rhodobacteraceae bacterium]|nr:O-antigen ligase family protein [Paracoccaceae bacterium]
MGFLSKINWPPVWFLFVIVMIGGVPFLGSLVTLIGAVASLTALYLIWKNPGKYRLTTATKPVLVGFVAVLATLCLSGLLNGEVPRFARTIPMFSQFLYFIPLIFVLPLTLRRLNVLHVSRAAMAGVGVTTILGFAQFTFFPSGCMSPKAGQPLCLELATGNPLVLAGCLMILILITPLGFSQKGLVERMLGFAIMAGGFFTFAYLADGRGAALSFVVMLPFLLVFLCRSVGWRVWPAAIGAGIVVLVLVLVVWTQWAQDSNRGIIARLAKIPESYAHVMAGDVAHSSTSKRIAMYAAGVQAVKQAPILGHGPQNRFLAAKPFLPPEFTQNFTHLHNMILTQWVASGILGVLALLATLLSPVWIAVRYLSGAENRDLRYMALVVSFGPILLGLTETIFFHDINATFHLFNILLFAALVTGRGQETGRGRQ